jgi:hypothetical protein
MTVAFEAFDRERTAGFEAHADECAARVEAVTAGRGLLQDRYDFLMARWMAREPREKVGVRTSLCTCCGLPSW